MSALPAKDNSGRPTSEYVAKIAALDDDGFVKEVAHRCWLSAYAANNPRSDYHWQADACYDEAERRQKPWLYQRGWNNAYRQAGYEPSEAEIKRAEGPQP